MKNGAGFDGVLLAVKDGIGRATQNTPAAYGSVLKIINQSAWCYAIVMNVFKYSMDVIIFGNEDLSSVGGLLVKSTDNYIINITNYPSGSVLDPLGNILNTDWLNYILDCFNVKNYFNRFQYIKDSVEGGIKRAIEVKAVGIIGRKSVNTPVLTGIKVLDSLIPIGRGQRELVIGDRQTGKTTIIVDAIHNQTKSYLSGEIDKHHVFSVYVAIGQKTSSLINAVASFLKFNFKKAVFIIAPSYFPAPLQYLAPYVGCSVGEWFRDLGFHALIAYDDLSKHAVAYRQMSLLLRRPPGREAYPGDIFYVHSRLLERAANLDSTLGSGSLTALPVIETLGGDVSAYIPTNVISITDGQIFLDADLFFKGVRPSINVGLSVSRVGSAAQNSLIRSITANLKLDLAQFREIEAFSQFDADLDAATESILQRGARLVNLLKQAPDNPLSEMAQYLILFAGTQGFCDSVALDKLSYVEESVAAKTLALFSPFLAHFDGVFAGFQIKKSAIVFSNSLVRGSLKNFLSIAGLVDNLQLSVVEAGKSNA